MQSASAAIEEEPKYRVGNHKEVWFLTTELESERASSFRQERWCQIFLEEGARLRIFNLRGAFNCSDVVCDDAVSLKTFRELGVVRNRGPQASVREGVLARMLRRLKHYFLVDLYLPNVITLHRKLEKLVGGRKDSIVLMASSPPFSVALVGALIKRRYPKKVTFAVDMRDAWAQHNALRGSKLLRGLIERFVLGQADRVTTVSKGLADEFKEHCGVDVGVMYNVATHYLDLPPTPKIDLQEVNKNIDSNRMTLIYTGSTPEFHYDVASVVAAAVRIKRDEPEIMQRLQLVFVGACQEVQREAEKQGIGLPEMVFVSHLPHAKARAVQASATALIFLAHHGPNNLGVVSTKLFEYLCLGRPIFPMDLCAGSDVDMLLREYCGSSVNVHGEEAISAVMTNLVTVGADALPRLNNPNRIRELLSPYRKHACELLQI